MANRTWGDGSRERAPSRAVERRPEPSGISGHDDVLRLQRLAGNRAVASFLAASDLATSGDPSPPVLAPEAVAQRAAGKPATLDEALRTGNSDDLEPFRPFKGITANQLLSLVNSVVSSWYVSGAEESILEEAWSSYGNQDANRSSLQATDWELWRSCAKRGADIRNVFWLRELRSQFATEVREEARHNLVENGKKLDAEARRLGVGSPAKEGSAEDKAVQELQTLAASVKRDKEALKGLALLDVGYAEPPLKPAASDNSEHGGTSAPGGAAPVRSRAPFNLDKEPPYPPEPGDDMPSWATVASVYRGLTASVAGTVNRNPALYALVSLESGDPAKGIGSDVLATPGQTPAQAREKIAVAFKQVTENIAKTREAIDDKSLGWEALRPVQERLYATHKVYRQPFAQAVAKAYVEDAGGDRASGQLLVSLGAAALILAVEIGTGGAATPLIGALIGLTASGAQAADSWNQWAKLDDAARASADREGAVVLPKQADEAMHDALLDTAFALLDVYGAGKAAAGLKAAGSAAKVAGLEARLAAKRRLADLAKLSVEEQRSLLSGVVEREGAQAAVQGTGRKAEELVAIVGRESPAGQKLAALAGLKQSTVDELVQTLPRLAEQGAAEAKTLVGQSIDVLGPAQTMHRAGGWDLVERAVAGDAAVMGRFESWRNGLVDQTAKVVGNAGGKEGRDAARSVLAASAGIPEGAVETALGVAVMFLDDHGEKLDGEADGFYSGVTIHLDDAASGLAAKHGVPAPGEAVQPLQRIVIGPSSPPLPMTERQLDRLSPDEFEEVVRSALRAGHFESEGLPRMSVLELKRNASGHGLDGVGFRRRGDLVDLYKLEFKQVTTGSSHMPELGATLTGIQGGPGWASANVGRLIDSDDSVAMETMDVLRARLRRYFGSRYSEGLLLQAFQHQIGKAPLIAVTRAHARLDRLVPQLRGVATLLGKGNVWLVKVRGR